MEPEGPGREGRLGPTNPPPLPRPVPPGSGCGLHDAGKVDDRCAPHARGVLRFDSRVAGGRPASLRGRSRTPGVRLAAPAPALQPQLVADAAHQVLRVDAELLQLVAVLLGIDLVRQLLLGLLDLVVSAALTQQLKDLVLRDLHGGSLGWGGWCCGRRAYSGSG